MNKKVYGILEFDKILKRLSEYTESENVKSTILSLEPHTELSEARSAQAETREAVSALLRFGNPPVRLSVSDISAGIKRAEIGGILSCRELLEICRVLYASRKMKAYLRELGEESEILFACGEQLTPCRALEDKINAAVISETEIADDASPELSAIRRKTKNLNAKIKEALSNMLHSEHYKKFLQDAIVTMRSDRYVIPVKAEYRSEVHGIVHDTSASGSTVFIEPMSVVNSNNEIRELMNKEEQEITKILSSLTAEASEAADLLLTDYRLLTRLDFIFCKGKFSIDYNGTEPILNDSGIIELKQARHPLIDKDKVVANDISLGGSFDTLVITGPNTGGKTVTLKTIGLFSLMAASGLQLPVRQSSRAAVFSSVYADIGDEQSIEQSLSTFSSHMVNIVEILKNVDSNSLALFDELGAGTDPTEGAALAISILEYLRTFKVKTAATTHYSELKLFALSTDGVENASCEFDIDSLRPTYRLLIGVPGKSNAFSISRRLGLDAFIIDRANELLSDESIKFEDVITDLELSRRKAQTEREYAERLKREMTDLRSELERERKKLKDNKARIIEDARREAKIIIMDAKDEANSIIKDLERLRRSSSKTELDEKVRNTREQLSKKEESIDAAMQRAAKPKKLYRKPPADLKIGDTVTIQTMGGQEASILKLADKNGMVQVQAGIIKLEVHISNLSKAEDTTAKQLSEKYVKTSAAYISKTKDASTEIDVRGQTSEEAVMNVEKFIDDCYLAAVSPVTIIHGKGTGVLKKSIQAMLKRSKHVSSFRPGRFGEGEDGVTIVEIK